MTPPGPIAIIGGTGKEGRGLAARWSRAGVEVVLGSREETRAAAAAAEVAAVSGGAVSGAENVAAAGVAALAVLATPYAGLDDTLPACAAALDGKLVVSAVIPLLFQDGRIDTVVPDEGSAAERVAALLPGSRVGAAFHNISAPLLLDLDHDLDEDVPVAADAPDDRDTIVALCLALGVRGVAAGGLSLARYLEGFTAVLLSVNRLHKTRAGVRFTGLP